MKEPLTSEDYADIFLENYMGLNLNRPKNYKKPESISFWEGLNSSKLSYNKDEEGDNT